MDEVRDPGVQPERTRLAWRRTTLTVTLVVVLVARKVVVSQGHGSTPAVAALAVSALLWVSFLGLAHRRMGRLAHGRRPPPVAGATMLGAAGVAVLIAVLGAVLIG